MRRPAVGLLRLVVIAVTTIMLAIAVWPNPYLPFLFTAIVGFVTILNPAVGIAVVLLTIPVQDAYLVLFVRGDLTYTQIALFGLVLGWLVTALRQRLWLDGIVAGFVAVFAAYAVSLVEMDDPALWASEVYRWTAAAIVYLISRAVLSTWNDVRIVLYGVVAGIIVAALTVVNQLQEQASSAAGLSMGNFRAMGAFGVPNPLAAYAEFGVPVLLVLSLFGLRSSLRARLGTTFWAMTILGSALGLAILALTQSRGGFIGFGAALVAIFFILPGRLKSATLVSGVVLVTVFTLTPVGQSQLDRFANVLEENRAPVENVHQGTLGRESLWIAGVRMIEDEPLTGIGAGEYDYHYREYVPDWVDRFPRGQAHNGWLQMGAQAGVPGIIAFSIWLVASLAALWGAARRSTDELARLLAWGGFAVMLAFSLHSLVDYLNVLSLGIQLSAVTAIGLSLAPDPLRTVQRRQSVSPATDNTYSATVMAR